jgi:hypothetical protein
VYAFAEPELTLHRYRENSPVASKARPVRETDVE